MTAAAYFASDYASARRRFRAAAESADARLDSLEHPGRGPDGEALSTEIAWLGPEDAEQVLVTVSGTHGAEGFCGSGAQVGWFESGLAGENVSEVAGGTALMAVHAINPHGFAWLRRVTEDNVDLNRNFVDHAGAHPENPGYDVLAEVICPREWNDAVIAETESRLAAYGAEHGAHALQRAIAGGQYKHRDGLFFGGQRDTWSKRALLGVAAERLAQARRVALIDYHTGLGPRGHGERICNHHPGTQAFERARAWWQEDITSPFLGNSASVELHGVSLNGLADALGHLELTAIALEYGTVDNRLVKRALRADNWLHVHGEPASAKGRAIKADVREAFYQDADDWKQMVWERAVETQRMALAGLAAG